MPVNITLKILTNLAEIVTTLKKSGVTVSVKIRAGVASDDRALAKALWKAGADILHVDLMDFGYQKLKQIRNSSPVLLIANNSLNTFDRVKDMFAHGADLVSLARKSDERTLSGLDAAITRYTDEQGWYNAPKQLCRGGDIRALTFCCMPVKNCPLIPTLDSLGIKRDEYIRLKEESVRGTLLEAGKNTCFGSLAWCCKNSSPCMFRDITIQQAGISSKEYMRLKRQLSEKIIHHIYHDQWRMTPAEQAQMAMMLEVTAYPKPGNVDRCHDYPSTRLEHFLASIILSRPSLERASEPGACVGAVIYDAVARQMSIPGVIPILERFCFLYPSLWEGISPVQ